MNYCSLDEAWGSNLLKDSRKKRKTKRLYTTQIPQHVYDKSYEEGSHDPHCKPDNKKNFTVKNKNRFQKSRGPKDIYRPKRSSRVDNINARYDEANKEYRKYKKETKRNTKNRLSNQEIVESNDFAPVFSNNLDDLEYLDGDEYSPIQENDMEIEPLPQGNDLSDAYTIQDNDLIQKRMFDMQQEQGAILKEQRDMVEKQLDNRGLNQNIEQFDDYYQNNNIEAFEGNQDNLDLMTLENFESESNEKERLEQIKDISSQNDNKGSKNLLNNLLKKKDNSKNNVAEENDSDSDSDSEEESLEPVSSDSDDLEYRINTLNRNVNLIIKKMNDSEIFNEDSQENIHDLILFILFGIFIIFVLDTIYRFGKKSKK